MTRYHCVHGVEFDIECDLCWDLVEEEVETKEKEKESE